MWERITTFVSEVKGEFARVTWPTRDDLVGSTTVVIVFSLAFGVFIGIFDLVLSYVRSVLVNL